MGTKNPCGINTGNALEKTTCPVHVSELKDLYRNEHESIPEIARRLAVPKSCVQKWFKLGGISTRSRSLAQVIYFAKTPEARVRMSINGYKLMTNPEHRAKLRAGHMRCMEDPYYRESFLAGGRRGRFIRNILAEKRRIKKICEHCIKEFSVPPSDHDRKYCNRACYRNSLSARRTTTPSD